MQLTFTYTLDDLVEASRPRRGAALGASRQLKPFRIAVRILIIMLLAALIWLLSQTSSYQRRSRLTSDADPVRWDLLLTIVPTLTTALITLLLVLFAVVAARAKARWNTPHSRRRDRRIQKLLGIAALAVVITSAFLLAFARWTVVDPARFTLVLLAFAPWIIMLLVLLPLLRRLRRSLVSRQWENTPSLHRAKTLQITTDGWHIRDELSESRHAWPYFLSASETDHLLILHDQDARMHMLPKRAFTDTPELQAAKALIHNHIPTTEFLPTNSAFPVLPKPVQKIETADERG